MGAKIDSGFSNLLNLCRWMAAFLVVISHVRGMVFPAAGGFDLHDPLSTLFYFVTGFGHSAVILFFVLSGYLVGGNALAGLRAGSFSPTDYFIARFSRIYTVFLPALALVLLLDLTGSRLFAASGFYTHPPALNLLYFSILDRLDAVTFLGNVAMLQTILVDPLGSDAPLWSLANEWWYYVVFGLFLTVVKGRPLMYRLLALAGTAGAVLALFPREISLWFLIWLAGAGLAVYEPRRKLPLAVGLPVFLLLFSVTRLPQIAQKLPSDFLKDAIVAVGFLSCLLSARQARRLPSIGSAINARLADFSYSVYLFHFPLMIFLSGLAARFLPIPGLTGTRGAACFLVLLGLLYLVTYGLSRVTEAKAPRIRAALRRFVTDRPSGFQIDNKST